MNGNVIEIGAIHRTLHTSGPNPVFVLVISGEDT